MIKFNIKIVLFILSLVVLNIITGCVNKEIDKSTFSVEEFVDEMKEKGYELEIEDVGKDFLPTKRKRVTINNEALDIYLYNNDKNMEKDAINISSDGCGYSNGSKSIEVSWISYPHFYKRGNIIVQYVGENKKIISNLIDIFGEQFAGY